MREHLVPVRHPLSQTDLPAEISDVFNEDDLDRSLVSDPPPGRPRQTESVLMRGIRQRPLPLELVPFVDLGAVWGAGAAATGPAADVPVFPSVGMGLHVV